MHTQRAQLWNADQSRAGTHMFPYSRQEVSACHQQAITILPAETQRASMSTMPVLRMALNSIRSSSLASVDGLPLSKAAEAIELKFTLNSMYPSRCRLQRQAVVSLSLVQGCHIPTLRSTGPGLFQQSSTHTPSCVVL